MSHKPWVTFLEFFPDKRKTKCWTVRTLEGGYLGDVKFWSAWRKYSFFPASRTLFEQDCLRDIADFCEKETKSWRASLRRKP